MTTENKYSKILLELKAHYQQTLTELEAQTSQLKTKITSLDTLIEDPLLGSDILSFLQGEADPLISEAPDSKVADSGKPKTEATKKAAPKASSPSSKKKSSTSKKAASQTKAKKTPKKANRSSSNIRPMQSPYTKMLKVDAIEKIMQENTGNSVHIDDLILKLYGEMSGDELKAERDRMYQTMYQGTQQNRWIKSPEEPMSYLIKANSKTKPETTTKSNKSDKKL